MWNIVGHESAISLLSRSLEKGVTAHAYLIVGPPHIGKMAFALEIAKALNCSAPEPPCGKCASCKKITEGKHADIQVIELQPAGESSEAARTKISVEQIDQILHSVNLPPFEGRRKVFIFDGFERTSIPAANRMLKTLEEPVSNVVFLLLTSEEVRVPATIVSRCQRIELFPLPVSVIEAALVERWGVVPEKAKLLARLSRGCPGWAVTMAKNESLLLQRGEWLDGWLAVLEAGYDERFAFAAKLVERFVQNRETVRQKLELLRDWWRDLMLVKAGNQDAISNVDRGELLQKQAEGYSISQIRQFIMDVQSAMWQLDKNVNPLLAIEVLMLNVPERGKVKEGIDIK